MTWHFRDILYIVAMGVLGLPIGNGFVRIIYQGDILFGGLELVGGIAIGIVLYVLEDRAEAREQKEVKQ